MSWFAVAAAVVTVVGAGVTAYSQHEQGKAQEEAAKANADAAQMQADNEELVGAENVKRQREESRRRLAAIRARMAVGGQQIGTGSALDVIGESTSELELQALDMFRDTEARSTQLQNQSRMLEWEGAQASTAGNLNATSSLISGLGSAAGGYASYKQSGVTRTGKR